MSGRVAAHRQPLRLELVTVAEVDRAKVFYVDRLGFTDEQDHRFDQTRLFVELTPPGSSCWNVPMAGYVDSKPGLSRGVPLNVEDVDAVQASLRAHGVEVSDVSSTRGGASASSSTPAATAGRSTSRRT